MRRALLLVLGLACVLTLVLACFGRVLLHDEQFAYRDAGHYYYPLYLRVQQEWAKHRLPLWDSRENAGMPLLGNPTAAVLYPGKVIYAALPYPSAARVYPIAHVLIGLVGMAWLLRRWGASTAASAFAGIAYAFSAPVLFQYCNVIYLVGAAWVPWGLGFADRWLRTGHRASIAGLAVVLAMQTLGGDPEAAYALGLCSGGYALGLSIARRREEAGRPPVRGWALALGLILLLIVWTTAVLAAAAYLPPGRKQGPPKGPLPWAWWWPKAVLGVWGLIALAWLGRRWSSGRGGPLLPRLAGLLGAGLLAGLLSAAQVMPTLEFTRQTMRATLDGPHDIYPFCVEPYRLAEAVWPEVFGSNRQANATWGVLIPPRHNTHTWVPSLYLGGLTIVLAVSAIGLRGLGARRVWLSWIAVVSLLAALGEYAGPLWYARCIPEVARRVGPHDPFDTGAIRADGKLRDGDGSLYNVMALTLPGFAGFRYPAKLLTFTCAALAGLAGIGLDRLAAGRWRGALVRSVGLAIVGALLLAAVQAGRPAILSWMQSRAANKGTSLFGPFDPARALFETRRALLHGTAAMSASAVVVALSRRRPRAAGALALLVLTGDLIAANAPLIITAPQKLFEEPPDLYQRIVEAEAADPSPGPFRVHRMPVWDPVGFYETGSPRRLEQMFEWERATIQPKYAIPWGISYTFTEGVAELYDYAWFFAPFLRDLPSADASQSGKPGQRVTYFPRRAYDLWATRYFIVPAVLGNSEQRGAYSLLIDAEPIAPSREQTQGAGGAKFLRDWEKTQDWRLLKNKRAHPRAWIVHSVAMLDPIERLSEKAARESRESLFEDMLYEADRYWYVPGRLVKDMHAMAYVESDDRNTLYYGVSFRQPDLSETVAITSADEDGQRVVLDVNLKSAGLVVLADVYYPGWELYIDGQPATIHRTNRLMRGAHVGEGHHRLVYVYNPQSARLGVSISLGALILTAGYLLSCRSRRYAEGLAATF